MKLKYAGWIIPIMAIILFSCNNTPLLSFTESEENAVKVCIDAFNSNVLYDKGFKYTSDNNKNSGFYFMIELKDFNFAKNTHLDMYDIGSICFLIFCNQLDGKERKKFDFIRIKVDSSETLKEFDFPIGDYYIAENNVPFCKSFLEKYISEDYKGMVSFFNPSLSDSGFVSKMESHTAKFGKPLRFMDAGFEIFKDDKTHATYLKFKFLLTRERLSRQYFEVVVDISKEPRQVVSLTID